MKKIIAIMSTTFFLISGLHAKVDSNLSDSQIKAVQELILLYGYKCDYVNFALRSSWSGDIRVSCNDTRYSYTIEEKGGRWTVTVR